MPWGTTDSTVEGEFQAELAERGQQREVRATTKPDIWFVTGDPKLGDTFDYYGVSLKGKRYECSCYAHAYGEVRRRRICGHVRDVIVWRKNDTARDERAEGVAKGSSNRRAAATSIPTGRETRDTDDPPTREATPTPKRHSRNKRGRTSLTPLSASLGDPRLPDQFRKFRRHQLPAIETIVGHFRDGKRVVILDAPTGSGKTIIGEVVRRLLQDSRQQTLYVCTSKSLQDQFVGDFPYAEILKGRANYPTADSPQRWPYFSAKSCDLKKGVCSYCTPMADGETVESICPYRIAKGKALRSPLSVLNTTYLLYSFQIQQRGIERAKRMKEKVPWIYPNFAQPPRDLIILDEADKLEGELMSFIEVVIPKALRSQLDVKLPQGVGKIESWRLWLKDLHSKLRGIELDEELEELPEKIERILNLIDDFWVVDQYEDARKKNTTYKPVRLRPTQIRDYARPYLWDHGKRWLLMSATIISAAQMAKDLGLEDHEWASVEMESTFPPERRPVFLDRHVGPVIRKNETQSRPKLVTELTRISEEWPEERILVHTHSYPLTKYLSDNLSLTRLVLSYDSPRTREGILSRWLLTNGILLAPSFDRGIDLYDDRCRVQVIVKAPFPYLGDKQVSKRMRGPGGQLWYTVETIRSIVQATGRVMRSEEDWGATYILDGSVWRLLTENGQLFPKWWREAVIRGLDSQSQKLRAGFEQVRGEAMKV